MNKAIFNFIVLSICFFINSCSNKKNPNPDQSSNQMVQTDSYTSNIDSVIILQKKQFYELENSNTIHVVMYTPSMEVLQKHMENEAELIAEAGGDTSPEANVITLCSD